MYRVQQFQATLEGPWSYSRNIFNPDFSLILKYSFNANQQGQVHNDGANSLSKYC